MNAELQVKESIGTENERSEASILPVVKYEKACKSFGHLQVLKDINLELWPGEKVSIIGPSGSGKTTLGRMLMTLEQPTSGSIYIDGEPLMAYGFEREACARNREASAPDAKQSRDGISAF